MSGKINKETGIVNAVFNSMKQHLTLKHIS